MQDMLKAFGFNSLQLYDIWQRYFDAGWHIPPEEWGRLAGRMVEKGRYRWSLIGMIELIKLR